MRFHLLLSALAGCIALPIVDASPAGAAPTGCADATPAAVSEFFDRSVPDRLAQGHVPGAVVSVVSGGKLVFAKGYGSADAERSVAFDPGRSLVRVASISKLFTWTAVMQQVQAGKLDLNADVNTYLTKFRIPATYQRPVTLLTLMNHTSGFEERFIGTGARTAGDVPPLGDYLATHMPARIRPPGEISAYSNYGAGLAGYIVSQVSGEPYDEYVRRHILDPLHMAHSTATEPVPAGLANDLARSYDTDTNPPQRIPFIFDPLTPDGAVSTTAEDIANFMIAHLDGGPILDRATLDTMHETTFTAAPGLGGYAHGFHTQNMNGHRVLWHDGGWEGFVSVLMLVPGCDLGLFVSANATGGAETFTDLVPRFFDAFAPALPTPDPLAGPGFGSGLTRAPATAGFYKPTRHNESTIEKFTTLLAPARLTVDGDGTVHFRGKVWKPDDDGRYTRDDGQDHLAFLAGPDGRRYLATDVTALQLMGAGETLPVNLVVLITFAVTALSALLLPLAAAWRRLRHRPRAQSGRWRAARWLAAGAALLGLVFLVLLAVVVVSGVSFLYGVPAGFVALLFVPVLALLAAFASLVLTLTGWRGAGAGPVARIHQVGLLAGLAALTWFLWQWNLIGWQLG